MSARKASGAASATLSVRVPPGAARALARLARHVEHTLASIDLSLPQYRALSLLGDGSTASSALAGRLAVSPPSVTAVIDGLVARGLVERQADPDDRRRLTLLLTPAGVKLLRGGRRPRSKRDSTRSAAVPRDPSTPPPRSTPCHGTARSTASAKRTSARK